MLLCALQELRCYPRSSRAEPECRETSVATTESEAVELLHAAHEAWNKRDVARLLDLFVDDMTYWSNVGGLQGPTIIPGKPAFQQYVAGLENMEGLSVPHSFKFKDGIGSASVEFFLRDRRTGHSHSGTFRQVLYYRDNKILRIEEYHDAAALAAFMNLLNAKTSALR